MHSSEFLYVEPRPLKAQRLAPALTLALGLVAAIASISGSAWGQERDWNAIVAAAKKEGRVTFYTSQAPAAADRLVAGFRKAYPDIAIGYLRLNSGPLISRTEQERNTKADGADLVISVDPIWCTGLAKVGALMRPAGPAAAAWPSAYLRDGAIVTAILEPFVIAYNTKLVPNPPSGYADLLKPEFKGKLGMSDIAGSPMNGLTFYDWLEKNQGGGYLVKLKAQNPRLYTSAGAAIQANASGELPISAYMNASSVTPLLEQGAPIGQVLPKPGFGFVYLAIAVGWSKRPNAALVLLDYLMSREGQSVLHSKKDTASPLPGIPGSLQASEITSWNPGDYPPERVKALTDRWNAIFKK